MLQIELQPRGDGHNMSIMAFAAIKQDKQRPMDLLGILYMQMEKLIQSDCGEWYPGWVFSSLIKWPNTLHEVRYCSWVKISFFYEIPVAIFL